MLLPRIYAPARAVIALSKASRSTIIRSSHALDALRFANAPFLSPTLTIVRNASHQSQGRANGAKDGPGKRLGAKKTGEEYVIPGNIIFKQRGTVWFPGENCAMGRDHTIYATESGYVKYYRDPVKHPKRQYIGVAFKRHESLPYPSNAARRRRLNMLATQVEPEPELQVGIPEGDIVVGEKIASESTVRAQPRAKAGSQLLMGKNYAYREANWQIGRAAERAGVKVREFVRGDRFRAWRKSAARKAANAERRGLRAKKRK
ncbi:hypothetical protein K432DRAFT_351940 [Lepidopterella palustris CBS 459.81]|uniref:Large ribosomal subunit protein bL27m n=1 Tax=Lepidopterella palustris CBS 459.81 TaxID=1314670 RepID=A0A8E2JFV8_9PEZI|nr:hypothetical protein K432DRAFT_351940 [Lepidopterella palustris CBS 459.81]